MDYSNLPGVPQAQTPAQDTNNLAHVNQEMYKKNLELAERNKTLSLLRKIDEIILSSVTDLREIAKQVCRILVDDGEFQAAAIYTISFDKKFIQLLGYALSSTLIQSSNEHEKVVSFKTEFPTESGQSIISQALAERVVKSTENPFELITINSKDPAETGGDLKISSNLVFPLYIRDHRIGVMVVSHKESVQMLSEYDWDLLQRLESVVGIALDNAMLYNEVRETNQKLKVLDRLKDEFVSLASHELRTPMTAIKSYLWLFLEDNRQRLTDQQKVYVERAYESTDRLIRLVNDMLNVSRIESNRLLLNKKYFDLASLINEVVTEITPIATEQKKSLSFHPVAPSAKVYADPEKLKQVLLNLIGNSLKFTPDGGQVIISLAADDATIRVSVADNGKGISKQDMGRLFKKFGILGNTNVLAHGAQSTGLGLYISMSIINLHGGKIWAESEGEGKGSVFSFSLPVVKSAPEPVTANISSPPGVNQQVSSGSLLSNPSPVSKPA